EAPARIKRIALDLVKHYTTHIEPNGYKAMLVAPSREAAVLYKEELDKLNAPPSKIIMTSNLGETGKDGISWDKYYLSSEHREQDIEGALEPLDALLVELKNRHADAMAFFTGIDKNSTDQIIEKFEPADVREEFEYAFKMLSNALDAVMPGKEADPYLEDFKFL